MVVRLLSLELWVECCLMSLMWVLTLGWYLVLTLRWCLVLGLGWWRDGLLELLVEMCWMRRCANFQDALSIGMPVRCRRLVLLCILMSVVRFLQKM